MDMYGTDQTDSQLFGRQPQHISSFTGLNPNYKYTLGCLRYARVLQSPTYYTGWVLCYKNGKPIVYADGNQAGSIQVSATGTYLTA